MPAKPPANGSTWSTVAQSHPPDPASGLPTVPGYELLEELGRGGMGVVYKARHVRLNRVVALKMILRAEHASAQERVRFRTEAESVARLRHPGIIQIHEVGEHNGRPFFALEFVAGGGLDRFLHRQPLPAREATALAEQLARAVQHAHEHGVVHRDLKPANVLLEGYESSAAGDLETLEAPPTVTLKIADFGLAKQLDNSDGPTGSQALLGTPSYMAPEQARGTTRDVGPPADIYALGATLYEMLTGRPPFRGATPADTVLQVLNDEPVPPRQIQPRLPRDLETICLKCLSKSPAKRYASAAELADDLARFREGRPVAARPASAAERLAKWVRRRPAAAALLALVAAALLGSLAAGLAFVSRAHRQRLHAEQLVKEAEAARKQTEAAAVLMQGHAEAEKKARALADQSRDDAEHHRQEAQLNLADLAIDRGIARCEEGDVAQGLLWFARGLELARATSPKLRPRAEALEQVARRQLAAWMPSLPVRVVRLLPHERGVECAAYRPDGKRILTGSADGLARLWEADGRPVGQPLKHGQPVRCVAWSPDGKAIATGTGDGWNAHGDSARRKGEAHLWDAVTGQLKQTLPHGGTVWSVAFSPDGKRLLTGCHDRRARLWEVNGGRLVEAVEQPQPVSCVAFFADGKAFVTATCENHWNGDSRTARVQRWEATTRKPLGEALLVNNVRALQVAPKGRVARVGGLDGHIRFLMPQGQAKRESIPSGSPVWAMAFGPSNRAVVTGGSDFKVRVRDLPDGQLVGQPVYLAAAVTCVAFGNDDDSFLTGDEVSARLWRVERSTNPVVWLEGVEKADKGEKLAVSPTGRDLVVLTDGSARLYDAATGKPRADAFTTPRASFAELGADGKTLLLRVGDRRFRAWDARSGKAMSKPIDVPEKVHAAELSPDGTLVVTCSGDDKVRVYELHTGKRLWEATSHGQPSAAAFAPDGKSVAVGTWHSVVQQWEARTGKPVGKPVRVHGAVSSVALAADSRTVLAGAHGPFYTFQGDTTTGHTNGVPLRHYAEQTAVSPDGRTLLTAKGKDFRLWDAATNKPVGPSLVHQGLESNFPGFGHKARTALFLDGRTVLTAGKNGQVRRWPLAPPVEGPAERVALWVRVRGGLALDAHGGVSHLSAGQWREAFEKLERLPGPALP